MSIEVEAPAGAAEILAKIAAEAAEISEVIAEEIAMIAKPSEINAEGISRGMAERRLNLATREGYHEEYSEEVLTSCYLLQGAADGSDRILHMHQYCLD